MREYPLIIVPEWDYLEPKFRQELVGYVEKGGHLLLIGPGPAGLFREELGVKCVGNQDRKSLTLKRGQRSCIVKTAAQTATLPAGATAFGSLQAESDTNAPSSPAASIAHLGRGTIAATYFTFSQAYLETHDDTARQFLQDLVRELVPTPLVEVTGSKDVDVVVNRMGKKLSINLVNTGGPHRTEPIIDTISEVGPLTVSIRQKSKPGGLRLEPAGLTLPFDYQAGVVRVTVPKLAIHEVLVVE
jgi:hypothetical protein